MAIHSYPIEVEADFLSRLSRASAVTALAELIWNSLDADARNVDVTFLYNELDGMDSIVIRDDGHGMTYLEAPNFFGKLGGSWKSLGKRTEHEERFLHGKDGNGRFRAFTLGEHVEWEVTYTKSEGPSTFTITMSGSNPKSVDISDESPAEESKPRGVCVRISNLNRDFRSLTSQAGLHELTEIFALYLSDYQSVAITVGGTKLDAVTAIASRQSVRLPDFCVDGQQLFALSLEIIEWHQLATRSLHLCNEQGFPLLPIEKRFHVGGYQFSAYLKSPYFSKLQAENRLALAPMHEPVNSLIDGAYQKIKEYFRKRAAESAKTLVQEWKDENIYPYSTEAVSEIDKVERQVFDIVASSVTAHVPEFESTPPKSKALHLRLLRHAIEKSPSDLQVILDEVLKLPQRQQEELALLLRDVSLSAVIGAAKLVADRLKFLVGLEAILYDADKKKALKERTQLHQIIAQNCWLFGEQFSLSISDQGLTEVLVKHLKATEQTIIIDEPVRHVSQTTGIVDLMLTRATRNHQPNTTSHLIVELKAPKVVVGRKEVSQVEGYAFSVARDERFLGRQIRWDFWVISDSYDDFAKERITDTSGRIHVKDSIQVFVKTWAQVLDENRARLQFFQEKLEYQAHKHSALAHLQKRYAQFLEGVIVTDDSADDASGDPKDGEIQS